MRTQIVRTAGMRAAVWAVVVHALALAASGYTLRGPFPLDTLLSVGPDWPSGTDQRVARFGLTFKYGYAMTMTCSGGRYWYWEGFGTVVSDAQNAYPVGDTTHDAGRLVEGMYCCDWVLDTTVACPVAYETYLIGGPYKIALDGTDTLWMRIDSITPPPRPHVDFVERTYWVRFDTVASAVGVRRSPAARSRPLGTGSILHDNLFDLRGRRVTSTRPAGVTLRGTVDGRASGRVRWSPPHVRP